MNELINLLKLSEFKLKIKLYKHLKQKNYNPIFKNGYLYAKGDIPILLVSHMDTVLDSPPKKFYYNEESDILYSNYGIGGDDRCGVYAILKIIEEYHPHILFTEKEEIGCIGAIKTIKTLPRPNVKYIIEIDRRGNNDCVFYDCNNQEFIQYIESFGFKTAEGIFSDISILGPYWDIATVNLSGAYYNEHTDEEYIKFKELENIIERIKNIIASHQNTKYYDYQDAIIANINVNNQSEEKYENQNNFNIENEQTNSQNDTSKTNNQQQTKKRILTKKE